MATFHIMVYIINQMETEVRYEKMMPSYTIEFCEKVIHEIFR